MFEGMVVFGRFFGSLWIRFALCRFKFALAKFFWLKALWLWHHLYGHRLGWAFKLFNFFHRFGARRGVRENGLLVLIHGE